MSRYNCEPWDDLSDLENHYCHPHEVYYEDLAGIQVCEFCREAKLAKYKIQKEKSDAGFLPEKTTS